MITNYPANKLDAPVRESDSNRIEMYSSVGCFITAFGL